MKRSAPDEEEMVGVARGGKNDNCDFIDFFFDNAIHKSRNRNETHKKKFDRFEKDMMK